MTPTLNASIPCIPGPDSDAHMTLLNPFRGEGQSAVGGMGDFGDRVEGGLDFGVAGRAHRLVKDAV